MAVRLIIFWLVLSALFGGAAWLLSRASRPALLLRVAVAAVVLAICAASFWVYGDRLDKTLGAVIGYFLLWGTVFVLSAASAGTILGSVIALAVADRSVRSS
jgi:hypothetical protein